MHVMGNVFLWLSVVLILAAVTLSTMVLDVRSKWLGEVEKRQQALVQSREQLREAELKVRGLEEDLQRRMHLWGDVWVANNSRYMPNGSLELGAGSSAGLGLKAQGEGRPQPAVYVFGQDAAGDTQYLGEFQLDQLLTDRASARPARQITPEEIQRWPTGQYRVRENLPGGWRSAFAELEAQRLITLAKLRTQEAELETLSNQIRLSQAALDQRLAELNGDANAPAGADQEVQDGLVETVRQFEATRNRLQREVSVLRRELDRKYVHLRQTLAANEAAANRLRESAADVGSKQQVQALPDRKPAVANQDF